MKFKYYVRYMDDFMIFHDSKKHLKYLKTEINNFLQTLRLTLNSKKAEIFPVKNGISFLGYQIYAGYRRIRKENIKRFIKRMKIKCKQYSSANIELKNVQQSLNAWLGYACHADTTVLTDRILSKLIFKR